MPKIGQRFENIYDSTRTIVPSQGATSCPGLRVLPGFRSLHCMFLHSWCTAIANSKSLGLFDNFKFLKCRRRDEQTQKSSI